MDFTGLSVLLQRLAREYETVRDAHEAVTKLARAEQDGAELVRASAELTAAVVGAELQLKELEQRRGSVARDISQAEATLGGLATQVKAAEKGFAAERDDRVAQMAALDAKLAGAETTLATARQAAAQVEQQRREREAALTATTQQLREREQALGEVKKQMAALARLGS